MEWNLIETAPKDGTVLLLWNGEVVMGYFETCLEWGKGSKPVNAWGTGFQTVSGYDAGFDRIAPPTHWMPLPEPPETNTD